MAFMRVGTRLTWLSRFSFRCSYLKKLPPAEFEALSPPQAQTITSTIMSKETNYPNLRQTRDGSNRFVRLRGCRGARPQGGALNAAPQVARVLFGASAREDGRSPAPA